MPGEPRVRLSSSERAAATAEALLATVVALYVSSHYATPLVWLFLPLAVLVVSRRSLSEYGLDLNFHPPSWRVHLWLGASSLALYAALHASVARFLLHQTFAPRLTTNLALDFVQEFLVVGVPEEVFFRGYLQSRWNAVFGKPWPCFGARVGPGLLLQAAVFALCHLATGDWTRLRVFFFALLAGWLRDRSGSILAPAVYHGAANVWYRFLAVSFR